MAQKQRKNSATPSVKKAVKRSSVKKTEFSERKTRKLTGEAPDGEVKPKHAGGRPTKYHEVFHPLLAKSLARNGLADNEIAKAMGVSESTLNKWKLDHEEFRVAIQQGKEPVDEEVEQALYRRAIGYSHPAVKILANGAKVSYIEHYPPDVRAIEFFLCNRRKDKYKLRQEVTGADGGPIVVEVKKDFEGV